MSTARKRSQRLEYMGTMAAGLAHEIRNPLSTMSVNLQLLAEDFAEAQTSKEQRTLKRARLLLGEVERLDGIVEDFLRLVRGYEMHSETVDLELLLNDLVRFVEPETQAHGIDVRISADPGGRLVHADPRFLHIALMNLVVNAQQAMVADGGELLIETRGREHDVEIRITDTGAGIPLEIQEKVFMPWYSTKEGGTGLGLPMTRRIIEEFGGELLLQSEAGRGSRFTARVPRAQRQLTGGAEGDPS